MLLINLNKTLLSAIRLIVREALMLGIKRWLFLATTFFLFIGVHTATAQATTESPPISEQPKDIQDTNELLKKKLNKPLNKSKSDRTGLKSPLPNTTRQHTSKIPARCCSQKRIT